MTCLQLKVSAKVLKKNWAKRVYLEKNQFLNIHFIGYRIFKTESHRSCTLFMSVVLSCQLFYHVSCFILVKLFHRVNVVAVKV